MKSKLRTHPAEKPLLERFEQFVDAAKNLRVFDGVAWESNKWDISGAYVHARSHNDRHYNLLFTERSGPRVPLDKRIPFEKRFGDLAKACIVKRQSARGMTPGPQTVFLRAVRYVYECCPLPIRLDPTRLCREQFISAELAAVQHEKLSSAYRVGQRLEEFARMLDRNGLTRARIDYRSSVPRPTAVADRTDAEFEERSKGLPSSGVLDALAEIANRVDVSNVDFDLLRSRIDEVLVIAGFRIGEMLTVPVNPLIWENVLDDNGEPTHDPVSGNLIMRLGIRYWPEKGGEPIVKWVPLVANELIERAIGDIDRLCRAARETASWLEAHPDRVNLGCSPGTFLTKNEMSDLLGLSRKFRRVDQWLKNRCRNALIVGPNQKKGMYARDFESIVARERFDKPVVKRRNGAVQRLPQTLIVVFKNAGHTARGTSGLIASPMTLQHMSSFLSGPRSVFNRYGYRGADGAEFRLTTHAFRRFVNTVAQRGGLSQLEIARWMGRRHLGDNAAYDLRSASELAKKYRQFLLSGDAFGTIADQIRELPESEREEFLKSALSMAHATPHGGCGSNIAEIPCKFALSCLGGCRHYMRRKNEPVSRRNLLRVREETIASLEMAKLAAAEHRHENARNWFLAQETTLKIINAALAIDDDPAILDGDLARVNPDGPVIGRPLGDYCD